jgi:hypothetical protein
VREVADLWQALRERSAFQVLDNQIVDTIGLADVVENTDVGMTQTGDDARFSIESLAQFSSVSEMTRKNLNGDNSVEASITGLVNFAHSARTDSGKDFVRP